MTFTLLVNGETHDLDVDPDMPLVWALREQLGLTGTKYGCGTYLRIRLGPGRPPR